jgi:hypothetical protein
MTNEELIATAKVALIRANKSGKDCVDLQKAINTLQYSIDINNELAIGFAKAVLLTEIEELK